MAIYDIYGNSIEGETSNGLMYDAVVFMGQSNMIGQSFASSSATILENEEGYEFKPVTEPRKISVAVEPFGAKQSNDNMSVYANSGMCTSIMKSFYDFSDNVKMIGMMCAVAGSGIDEWQKGTTYYTETLDRIAILKSFLETFGYSSKIRHFYMCWCQGEHEATNKSTSEYYIEQFNAMLSNLITDAGFEKCFVMRIGSYSGVTDERCETIMNAQNTICLSNEHAIMASTKLSEQTEYVDTYHFTQYEYNLVGADVGKNIAYYWNTGKEPVMYDSIHDNLYYSKKS